MTKEDLIKLIDAIKERNQLINDIVKEIDGDGIRLSREIDSKISDAKILHLKPQTEKQRRFLFLELQEA